MITAAAGFHIILYSVPPMRLQRRPSAAPRCSRGRSWEGRPYLGDRRAHSPGAFTAALLRRRRGRRAGGPEPAGGPGEDQQHDDNGHEPPTTRAWPRVHRPRLPIAPPATDPPPSMASAPSIVRLRCVHLGRAPGAASGNGGPLPPFTRIPARMIQDWALSRADWWRRGRGCPPRLDGPATARLICGRHP
jgi:hypothetical protein